VRSDMARSKRGAVAFSPGCHLSLRDRIHGASSVPRDHSRLLFVEEWFDCCPFWSLPGLSARRWVRRNGEHTSHIMPLRRPGSRFYAGAIRTTRKDPRLFRQAANSQSQSRLVPRSSLFVARQSTSLISQRT